MSTTRSCVRRSSLLRTGFVSDRTILLLEDETKCQVEFYDLCVHRSL
ncbi:MAG: hypothetical protein RMZ43_014325 [Nostoc sp. CmiVER01]|nr:hypothetical protein [Nostoc sp. CmiVER01]MDZ8124791.1 hypothetical protein [Nostoc sp. CmiVER01]